MKFHHIGIAAEDINKTINYIKELMPVINISDIVYDELQDASLCMITLEDNTKIELISGKVVENVLKKRQFLYHTCYGVNNIEESVKKLISLGALQVNEVKPAVLFNNKKVVFLMTELGLIELVED